MNVRFYYIFVSITNCVTFAILMLVNIFLNYT